MEVIMNGISTRFLRASLFVVILGGINFCMAAKPKVKVQGVKKVAVAKVPAVKAPVVQAPQILDVSGLLIQEVAKGNSCSLEKVKEFIKGGADVNAKDEKDGATALMVASFFSNSEVVKELLRVSPSCVNITDENGSTALLYALYQRVVISGQDTNKIMETVKELIKAGADVNVKDEKNGVTALMLASLFGYSEVAKELVMVSTSGVNIKDKNGSTALLYALHESSGQDTSKIMETVKTLVQAGADVNSENASGHTPLILGCISPVIMKYLIDNKANVNAQNKYGKTVLIHGGYIALNTIRLLNDPKHPFFSKPENQEAKNRLLKQVQDNVLEFIAILINAGADVTLKDNNGVDALMIAKECDVQEFMWALQGSRGGLFGPLYSSMAWAKVKLGFNKKSSN